VNSTNRLGATIGSIFLVITLIFGIIGLINVSAFPNAITSEQVNLNINSTFDLTNTNSIEFDRNFALSRKQDIFLLHIKCQSTENIVKNVKVSAILNGIEFLEVFEDSNSNYFSPHTFLIGTTLTIRINDSIPIYILSNLINLKITVESNSIFNSGKGDFIIDEVIFETITPPIVTSTSENTPLPLQISQGIWYVSPLTLLKERSLTSEIFIYIIENVRVRIDISLSPSSVPLSLIDFTVFTPQSSFKSDDSSISTTIVADLMKEDRLYLNFRFRASTELTTDVVDLTIDVTVTNLPFFQPNNAPGELSDPSIPNLPMTFLEAIRLLMIVIPSFLFYKSKKSKKMLKKNNLSENNVVS
jgi:hypothetical protein